MTRFDEIREMCYNVSSWVAVGRTRMATLAAHVFVHGADKEGSLCQQ